MIYVSAIQSYDSSLEKGHISLSYKDKDYKKKFWV